MRTFDSWQQVQSTQQVETQTHRSKEKLFVAALSRRMRSTVAVQILILFFPPKDKPAFLVLETSAASAVDEFIRGSNFAHLTPPPVPTPPSSV